MAELSAFLHAVLAVLGGESPAMQSDEAEAEATGPKLEVLTTISFESHGRQAAEAAKDVELALEGMVIFGSESGARHSRTNDIQAATKLELGSVGDLGEAAWRTEHCAAEGLHGEGSRLRFTRTGRGVRLEGLSRGVVRDELGNKTGDDVLCDEEGEEGTRACGRPWQGSPGRRFCHGPGNSGVVERVHGWCTNRFEYRFRPSFLPGCAVFVPELGLRGPKLISFAAMPFPGRQGRKANTGIGSARCDGVVSWVPRRPRLRDGAAEGVGVAKRSLARGQLAS